MSNTTATEVLPQIAPAQAPQAAKPVKRVKVRKPSLIIPFILVMFAFVAQGSAVQGYAHLPVGILVQFLIGNIVNLLILWFFVNVVRRFVGFAKVQAPKVNKAMKVAGKLKK